MLKNALLCSFIYFSLCLFFGFDHLEAQSNCWFNKHNEVTKGYKYTLYRSLPHADLSFRFMCLSPDFWFLFLL